ncbi:glycosyltransferase [Paenibacillus sp. KQZ6P-2]|uniref:Glycosyltransferase n=2 Tax=Paenibacillus mangrovi TaxID=2931978 RepID=A0A9X1WKN3_9BACL|nr:glycosyltransferase [Paenibacillus mangrovi]
MDCTIYNESNRADAQQHIIAIGSYKKLLFKIPFIRGDLFHFHTIDPRLRMLLGFYKLLGKKIMLTIHGESLSQQLQQAGPMKRKLLLASLKRIDHIVSVSERTTKMLLDLGFNSDQVSTIPAYIHPVERMEDERALPAEVHQFMDHPDFVISANGFVRLFQNYDLYGIDLLIELVKDLTENLIPVRMLFALLGAADQSADERRYYEAMKQRIMDYGLAERFYFYEAANTELYPILKKSRLFIRPTCMDGYGVSIAESLHYKVPAVASNVCRRPEGTILFQSRDLTDLKGVVRQVIHDYENCKQSVSDAITEDYAADLIAVYRRISDPKPLKGKVMSRANR